MLPSVLPRLAQTRPRECFLVFGNFSLFKTPFPGPSSSGDEVFGECGCCDLSLPPSLPHGFLGVQPAHLLRQMLTVQNPKKS